MKTCVFDVYGTIFDVHSAAAQCRDDLVDKAYQGSNTWRKKQLQYSWLLSLMQKFGPFWRVTGEALDFALAEFRPNDTALRQKLINLYLKLKRYLEVPGVLKMLKRARKYTGVLSNGSRETLDSAVDNSSLGDVLDTCLSVNHVVVFKIDPRVCKMTTDRFNCTPPEICFMSSNTWDAWAASHFGFQVASVNFFNQPPENAPCGLAAEITTQEELPPLLDL